MKALSKTELRYSNAYRIHSKIGLTLVSFKRYSKHMKSVNRNSLIKNEHRTLSGAITQVLRDEILAGELSGGAQLKQEELAARFGVSMSALREALKNLEAEGLVRFYPNRGAIVTALSAEDAQEIFDIRLYLELGALELSIPHLTEAALTEADSLLQAANVEPQSKRWGELNWRFHEVLYRPADRPKLLLLIRTMNNNVERYMNLYLSTLHYQEKSQAEHRELIAACRQRNVQEAQQILRKHMRDACASLTGYLKQDQN